MTRRTMPTEIYLHHNHLGYEVQYNVMTDCLEVRHLHWIPEGAFYGDRDNIYSYHRDGALRNVLVREHEDWRPYPDFDRELLEEGRNRAQEIFDEITAPAEPEDTRTPMDVQIDTWGENLTVDGEPLDHVEFMGGEPEATRFYPNRRLQNGPLTESIFNGPMVSVREREGGVEISMSYLAYE